MAPKIATPFRALILTVSLFAASCVTQPTDRTYGLQPEYLGYVAARIAVLPCQKWPSAAPLADQPASTASAADVSALCADLDQQVLNAFKNQPYMRGLSPKVVRSLLDQAGKSALLARESPMLSAKECPSCRNLPTYYAQRVAVKPEWRAWLNQLSEATRDADALLLPFVVNASETHADDRGADAVTRQAAVSLLLIDTNNGHLIWAGEREAQLTNERLAGSGVGATSPAWKTLDERLFASDLWRDFPGREINPGTT